MKILFLGPECENIVHFLSSCGDEVTRFEEPLSEKSELLDANDFIVSYRYRHILNEKIVDRFSRKAINLHISLLPWNKGSDPNIWSFLEDSPKGVTIHYMSYKLDTGEIVSQKEISYLPEDTLRTSYERLTTSIEDLFKEVWKKLRLGNYESKPQSTGGSYHRKSDLVKFEHLLTHGWETPVKDLIGKAKKRS